MSKLNPQNATAYVGPGVLRKGGKITPVPNGPLIKKKGPFKGSTLKAGGKINSLKNKKMTTIKKAQTGTAIKKPVKVTTKKPKTASQRIGDLTLRDVKNSTEDALNIATLGGYKTAKEKVKKLTGMKSGGVIKKAKCGTKMKKK